jgi:hypothetical protein
MTKTFQYKQDREQIIQYMKLSPEEKLRWLEEMKEFNDNALSDKAKRAREYFHKEEYKNPQS